MQRKLFYSYPCSVTKKAEWMRMCAADHLEWYVQDNQGVYEGKRWALYLVKTTWIAGHRE